MQSAHALTSHPSLPLLPGRPLAAAQQRAADPAVPAPSTPASLVGNGSAGSTSAGNVALTGNVALAGNVPSRSGGRYLSLRPFARSQDRARDTNDMSRDTNDTALDTNDTARDDVTRMKETLYPLLHPRHRMPRRYAFPLCTCPLPAKTRPAENPSCFEVRPMVA